MSDFHYGFRSFLSPAILLAVVSDRFDRNFNRSKVNRAVALDMLKVFDRVWHAGLLYRLKSYEIMGVLALFCHFLVINIFRYFQIGGLDKSIILMLEFLKAFFFILHFSYYTFCL